MRTDDANREGKMVNDDLLKARQEAVRRARITKEQQRITYDGSYHVQSADALYDGGTVEFVSEHACNLPEEQ